MSYEPEPILAERLMDRLGAAGKTAKAASLEAGLVEHTVRDIITGSGEAPSVATLKRLAIVLGCSVGYLIGETVHARPEAAAPIDINTHDEADAKLMWCPFVRAFDGADNGSATSTNRPLAYDHNPRKSLNCIASGCMAWVWSGDGDDTGFCGLVRRERTGA